MTAEMNFIPAEAFPPGELVREELAERGWTQADLAEILGVSERLVSEVVGGKRGISAGTAQGLAAAFGTSAQFWLNLESSYRLYREAQSGTRMESVSRRARLFSIAPVNEMLKRGWLPPSSNIEVLERHFCEFFEISNIDETPTFVPHAAKKSGSYEAVSSSLMTWLHRARQLANASVPTGTFKADSVARIVAKLGGLLQAAIETRNVARILSDHGIRFVIAEPISKTKLDGVTFWLDAKSPVIAMTLRYDRIDSFWFTLLHELGHVDARDGQADRLPIVDDLDLLRKPDDLPESERRAHAFASATLVPADELTDFVARTRPLYSKVRIDNFAKRIKVHPGIVVGQLHHRHEFDWSYHRAFLVKVREHVVGTTLTDGWGFAPLAL